MIKKLITTLAIATLISHVSIAQNYSQSVKYFAEGKYYKNSETGRSVKYGYISSLNTYGVTFKDAEGNLANFMNCNEQLSSDEQYMELTYCMSPNTGGTLGTIGVSKHKIVLNSSDGSLTFYLDNKEVNKKSEKSDKEKAADIIASLGNYIPPPDFYIINNLKVFNGGIYRTGFNVEQINNYILEDEDLGKGWRLPTRNELLLMIKNRDSIGMNNNPPYSYLGIENNQLIHGNALNGLIEPVKSNIVLGYMLFTPVKTIYLNNKKPTTKKTLKK
jgi:hypothetical protein